MLKYLALAASLAVASCGMAPAYAADCPQNTISLDDAIANLESYGNRFEVIGVYPVPATDGSAVLIAREGQRVYSTPTVGGCVVPGSTRLEGIYKPEREA